MSLSSVVLLPSHSVMEIRRESGLPIASGDFSDIIEGRQPEPGVRFALKRRRVSGEDNPETVEMELLHEIEMWKMLEHENILRFMGAVVLDASLPPCTVSPLMENGTVTQYLRANPAENRRRLVMEVCQGLQYLHSRDIVHGELKGAHVLVSAFGNVCLCGFTFAVVRKGLEPISVTATMSYPCSSWPWLGRELLFPGTVTALTRGQSKSGDAYSLGMTALEIFSGKRPFHGTPETAMISKVWAGITPAKPDEASAPGMTNAIWALIKMCWVRERSNRPSVSSFLECVRSEAVL